MLARYRRISVKWKVYIYLVGFCFILLFILWLFQIVLLDVFYKRIRISEVEKSATQVVQYIVDNEYEKLNEMVQNTGDLYVEIWRPNETGSTTTQIQVTVGQTSQTVKQLLATPGKKMEILEHVRERGSYTEYCYSDGSGFRLGRDRENIIHASFLPNSSDTSHLLIVSADLSPVNSTVNTLRIQLYYISAIMILLAAIISLKISRHVSEPIEQLTRSARQLGKGNYDVPFRARGYREIEELSDTLAHASCELSKTEALRNELIANVSHDLRTPLTLITGYSEMMRDLPDENTPQNMQTIIDEATRLTTLVNDLLDLSKMQSGTQRINPETFSITKETSQIIERFSRFKEHDGYQIEFVHDADVTVYADPDRISQVIYNLMTNAMTHTGPDKKIQVRQTVQDRHVMIEIADTGEGIAPEDLPYVWDRYYKVDKVHKRAVTGAGLGLSIVRAILDQHPDVRYGVRSEQGNGTVFWFSLPVSNSTTEYTRIDRKSE